MDEKLKKSKQNINDNLLNLSSLDKVQLKFDSLIQQVLPEEFENLLGRVAPH